MDSRMISAVKNLSSLFVKVSFVKYFGPWFPNAMIIVSVKSIKIEENVKCGVAGHGILTCSVV